MDSSNNINLDTSAVKRFENLYLEAASDTSTTNAYLPLFLSVSNSAPFFQDGAPPA
jgi:hypothetical protein